jgi:hypothetical protein
MKERNKTKASGEIFVLFHTKDFFQEEENLRQERFRRTCCGAHGKKLKYRSLSKNGEKGSLTLDDHNALWHESWIMKVFYALTHSHLIRASCSAYISIYYVERDGQERVGCCLSHNELGNFFKKIYTHTQTHLFIYKNIQKMLHLTN